MVSPAQKPTPTHKRRKREPYRLPFPRGRSQRKRRKSGPANSYYHPCRPKYSPATLFHPRKILRATKPPVQNSSHFLQNRRITGLFSPVDEISLAKMGNLCYNDKAISSGGWGKDTRSPGSRSASPAFRAPPRRCALAAPGGTSRPIFRRYFL